MPVTEFVCIINVTLNVVVCVIVWQSAIYGMLHVRIHRRVHQVSWGKIQSNCHDMTGCLNFMVQRGWKPYYTLARPDLDYESYWATCWDEITDFFIHSPFLRSPNFIELLCVGTFASWHFTLDDCPWPNVYPLLLGPFPMWHSPPTILH